MVETVTCTESIPERLVSQWLERKSSLNDLFCLSIPLLLLITTLNRPFQYAQTHLCKYSKSKQNTVHSCGTRKYIEIF